MDGSRCTTRHAFAAFLLFASLLRLARTIQPEHRRCRGTTRRGGGDAGGRTADDIAEEEGRLEIAQFLRETRAFRLLPVAMGWHPRLGADSPLILLDPGLLRVIATFPIT